MYTFYRKVKGKVTMRKYSEKYFEFLRNMGEKIERYRIQCGYSQKELAELAGYSEKYIKSLELGEAKGTKLSRIIKIAQVLRVKVYKLF